MYNKKFVQPRCCINKFLLMMKLTTLLLIVTIMQVNANSFAQKVTLSEKGATLKNVFKKIKQQTGYDFVYAAKNLSEIKRIDIHVSNQELKEVLDRLFKGQQLEYRIQDRYIVVSNKEALPKQISQMPISTMSRQDSVTYRGRVVDEKGVPLAGASVRIKDSKRASTTTPDGYFAIFGPQKAILVFSYVGYGNREIAVQGSSALVPLKVVLSTASTDLEGVNIVSTGYQDIPKERATGSFEVITAKQLAHSTSPNLLKRLEGIAASLDFRNDTRPTNSSMRNANQSRLEKLTIRGRNTLEYPSSQNPSGRPLVVIDGIPNAYDIDLINPDDVESVTILKDAASASIWGSRAANGVLVIKTKKGGFNKRPTVSFNTSLDISDKIDFYYRDQMSVPEFIEAQRYAFDQKFPLDNYPIGSTPLGEIDKSTAQLMESPVFEILNSQRKGSITMDEANRQLEALGKNDIRKEYAKYFLRNPLVQRYNLAVSGGTLASAYRLSAGYTHSVANTKMAGSDRFSLAYNTTIKPLKNLTVDAGITYVQGTNRNQSNYSSITGDFTQEPFFPYSRLTDDQGNAAVVPKGYRPGFLDALESSYGDKILDTRYRPLQDIKESSAVTKSHVFGLNTKVNYKLNDFLSTDINYSYDKTLVNLSDLVGQNTYYMRDLINRFTNPTTFQRAIPLGAQNWINSGDNDSHTLRALLNLDKSWSDLKHQLTGIIGLEAIQDINRIRSDYYLGYNKKDLVINTLLDYQTYHPTLFTSRDGQSTARIPNPGITAGDYKQRSYSLFSNLAYTYNQKYTLSASVRRDASSEFGLGTNSKGAPFFHVGAAWDIAKESFYPLSWLPSLKMRATYGHNGNTNARVPANPVITYSPYPAMTGLNYATPTADYVTNSKLRPEVTGMLNIGLDFATNTGRISGSLEYYDKRTTDLIQSANVDPTLGYNKLVYNAGNLHGYGVDINLNTINVQTLGFSWSSAFLFSYNRVKVTKLYTPAVKQSLYVIGEGAFNITEGYDLNRIFAYQWKGLDPTTGDPRIILNGKTLSIEAAEVPDFTTSPVSDLRYMGSSVPVYYGSLRNTFNYKGFSASFNLLYKLGYYQRRPFSDIIQYGSLYGQYQNQLQGAEYNRRWQKPGDEKLTNVPSQRYAPGYLSTGRDLAYAYSDINVIKADHIRLQEVNLSYQFKVTKGFLKNPRISANVNELGVIWRANKIGVDPDILDYPNPRQYSLGFSANF